MAERPDEADIAKWHRWFAVECNNRAWELAGLEDRSPAQTEEMLDSAHASALHWSKVGSERNVALAHMLLGHAYAAAGQGGFAINHAKRCFEYISANLSADWELAFAHTVLAHAAHAAGDGDTHARHYLESARLGETLADPKDRELFMETFRRVPRP